MKIVGKSSSLEELLDVVDEQNQIIGQAKRGEIHQKNLRHRSTHILINNSQGDVFLQKRSKNKDELPGYWDTSAAGHVDVGESYDQCIVREVQEELGIQLFEMPEKLYLMSACVENGMEFCQVYRLEHAGPFVLDPEEVEEGHWFSLPELKEWLAVGGEGLTYSLKVMLAKLYPDLKITGV